MKGHLHPITQFVREIVAIFAEMGFVVASGPELETEYYNFDVLNTPKDHPSRDMQDTFWIKSKDRLVMRTHTTSTTLGRFLEQNKDNLPCAAVVPGKVFRNEATDATHEAQFYQLDSVYVTKDASLGHLKGVIEHFLKKMYGEDIVIRFRPSFFSFVEPGIEVDMLFNGKWLEMGGAGMIHPNVFKAAGIDPTIWKGFAFGFGVDRLVMLRHGISDVRTLYDGDLRLINQF
jgi:phenylalanyl-tRNA synthetase alpha chain